MWIVIKHYSNAIITVVQTRCKVTAFAVYDQEALKIRKDERLELWNNGTLVSHCQYAKKERKHANG